MTETITLLDDYVAFTVADTSQKEVSGLVVVQQQGEELLTGHVIQTGPGKEFPMDVKVGDSILIHHADAKKTKINGLEVYLARESEIMAII